MFGMSFDPVSYHSSVNKIGTCLYKYTFFDTFQLHYFV